MICPPALIRGDKIAIISTARAISKIEISDALYLIKQWGFKPIIGDTIDKKHYQLAGTDEERAKDFQNKLNNPTIKAIWFARGGNGSIRILDMIDFTILKNTPKWLIGYSDVTAIHTTVNQFMCSIHAIMPFEVKQKSFIALESLKEVLKKETVSYQLPINSYRYNLGEKISGILLGGNLSLLVSMIGTPSMPNTTNAILLIEETDEYLYCLDRMFLQLKRAGILSKVKAILLGSLTQIKDDTTAFGYTAKELIIMHTKQTPIPIFFDIPCGHTSDNRAFILGKEITISTNKKRELHLKQ